MGYLGSKPAATKPSLPISVRHPLPLELLKGAEVDNDDSRERGDDGYGCGCCDRGELVATLVAVRMFVLSINPLAAVGRFTWSTIRKRASLGTTSPASVASIIGVDASEFTRKRQRPSPCAPGSRKKAHHGNSLNSSVARRWMMARTDTVLSRPRALPPDRAAGVPTPRNGYIPLGSGTVAVIAPP